MKDEKPKERLGWRDVPGAIFWTVLLAVWIAHEFGYRNFGRTAAVAVVVGYLLYVVTLGLAAILTSKFDSLRKHHDSVIARLVIHGIVIAFVTVLYFGSRYGGGYVDTDCRPAGPGIYNDC